jgi:hypothetical protein
MCPTSDAEKLYMNRVPYAELVGSLNWLANCTRPDIATAVGTLCRFIGNPGKQHWTAAQRVLRYLAGTMNLGITYTRSNEPCLTGYADADWAGDPDTRRSTTGYVFLFAGGAIAWKSKLQSSTALSSTEAEYIAISAAAREAKWIRQLLLDLGYPVSGPTTIFEDNKGCEAIAMNRRTDKRSKHIDVRYHFIRDMIERMEVHIEHIPTAQMVADVMTKPAAVNKFVWCRKQMGIDLRGGVEIQANIPHTSGTDSVVLRPQNILKPRYMGKP